jgi:hypothetical protein
MENTKYNISDFMQDFIKLDNINSTIHTLQHYENIFNNIKKNYDDLYNENIELRKEMIKIQSHNVALLLENQKLDK